MRVSEMDSRGEISEEIIGAPRARRNEISCRANLDSEARITLSKFIEDLAAVRQMEIDRLTVRSRGKKPLTEIEKAVDDKILKETIREIIWLCKTSESRQLPFIYKFPALLKWSLIEDGQVAEIASKYKRFSSGEDLTDGLEELIKQVCEYLDKF